MLQFIIPMLILTGARKREVLDAKWEDFNVEQRVWRIPLAKSGKARHVPMSDGVLSLLASVPMYDDCTYVFANPKTFLPYVSFFSAWNTVRKSVGLGDVRVHDLRHSFASFLVNSGRSLYEVQRILGHTQIKTTQRYAHLSQDSLLAAANEISKAVPLLNMMPCRVLDVPLLQAM
jgi:integrase